MCCTSAFGRCLLTRWGAVFWCGMLCCVPDLISAPTAPRSSVPLLLSPPPRPPCTHDRASRPRLSSSGGTASAHQRPSGHCYSWFTRAPQRYVSAVAQPALASAFLHKVSVHLGIIAPSMHRSYIKPTRHHGMMIAPPVGHDQVPHHNRRRALRCSKKLVSALGNAVLMLCCSVLLCCCDCCDTHTQVDDDLLTRIVAATERPDALDAFTSILLSPRTQLTFDEMLARLECPVCLAYGEWVVVVCVIFWGGGRSMCPCGGGTTYWRVIAGCPQTAVVAAGACLDLPQALVSASKSTCQFPAPPKLSQATVL